MSVKTCSSLKFDFGATGRRIFGFSIVVSDSDFYDLILLLTLICSIPSSKDGGV